jgi:hypothetical protein
MLSIQAPQYEQYRFNRLEFQYIPRVSTATAGAIMLAPDYDASDISPTTEAQLLNYSEAVDDNVWKPISCAINCSKVTPGPRKFIRSGNVAGDIKTYDALNFYFGSVDETDGSSVGKLFVEYEVELSDPQNSPGDQAGPSRQSFFQQSTAQSFATGVAEPMDLSVKTYDPLNIGTPATGVFTPPKGVYRLDAYGTFSDTSAETFTIQMEIMKNGVALSQPAKSIDASTNIAGGNRSAGPVSGIISCNGTDTFQIQVTLTGAAGTLASTANCGGLLVSVV